jgi:hypothetical protein
MTNGIVPRAQIDCGQVEGATNDNIRLDGRRNHNCLSIAFPNSLMFYKFQNDNPGVEWPILVIHPILLSTRKALFCHDNAASGLISQVSDDDLGSLSALKGIFDERDGITSRADQFLKPCDPTNVQAEILIEGIIPAEAIYHVIYPSVPCQNQYASIIGNRKFNVSNRRGFYGTRQYYRQWGHGK